MRRRTTVYIVLVGVMLLAVVTGYADDKTGEEINWQVISSGGTDGASANYRMVGTTSQTATGSGSSPNYGVDHGYWQDFACGDACCVVRGDIDHSGGVSPIDISDLVYLVNWMFQGGLTPPCIDEANADGSLVPPPVDISDLVYMVNYMFQSGPSPVPCP